MKRFFLFSVIALFLLACMTSAALIKATPAASEASVRRPAVKVSASPSPTATPVLETRAVCRAPWLHVRDKPLGKILSALEEGATVTVYEMRDGWARIEVGRWVNGAYLCPR